MAERIALFPGSFDPFTNGHLDVVKRGLSLFDHIIISIGVNTTKKRYFSVETMVEKIDFIFQNDPRVTVESFSGLTGNFARDKNAQFLLRGLRNTTDFEYENTIAKANSHVFHGLETVFLITDPAVAHISSTIVRDLHKYGADVKDFLPYKL